MNVKKSHSKLSIAKKVIEEHLDKAQCGIYNVRNFVGDPMHNIYSQNGLLIDICYAYMYFEVFGLTEKQFAELEKYYRKLVYKKWLNL